MLHWLQPLLSVTVYVYVPAVSPACDAVIVYPLFLHVALPISEPFVPPLHVTLVTTCVVVIGGGCVIVTDVVAVHPLLSVTVNVYVPAVSPACDGVIVYPGVPPLGVITTEPFVPPLHVTLVTTFAVCYCICICTCCESCL